MLAAASRIHVKSMVGRLDGTASVVRMWGARLENCKDEDKPMVAAILEEVDQLHSKIIEASQTMDESMYYRSSLNYKRTMTEFHLKKLDIEPFVAKAGGKVACNDCANSSRTRSRTPPRRSPRRNLSEILDELSEGEVNCHDRVGGLSCVVGPKGL